MSNEKDDLISKINSMNLEELQELIKLNEFIKSEKVKEINSAELVAKPEQPSFLEKAKSFAKAYASRGLSNNKAEEKVKSLRVLSCHGGENLDPCPFRVKSEKYNDSYYCGVCGCGDKGNTQLVNITLENGTQSYSKLDFPKVYCPMTMPGFSNYEQHPTDKNVSQNPRKMFLESALGVEYIKQNSNLDNGDKNEHNSNNNETKQENS